VRTRGDLPALGPSIPDGQIVTRQGEADSLRLAWSEVDTIEPTQLVGRSVRRRRWRDIELRNFVSGTSAVVRQCERDGEDRGM
jgi:hypothetical protein